MSECNLVAENMPLLLTESLDRNRRELTHQHIESCAVCGQEWSAYKETWSVLGELPEIEVPARVRDRFLATVDRSQQIPANVVPFRRRPVAKWLTQAAAVAVIAGGAYFAARSPRRYSRARPRRMGWRSGSGTRRCGP